MPAFFVDLAHAGEHVLVRIELAAESVVLAEVLVVGARVAMDHQHAASVRRESTYPRVATIGE